MSRLSPKPLDLGRFLPYRLSVVTNRISRNLGSLYAKRFRLSIAEWRIMAVLGQTSDVSADEVCRRTEMDKVTVSRAVTKLLEKKYILRRFSDEDRRRSMLRLSRTGYGVYAQIVPLALAYEKQLLSGLTRQEQRQLDLLLEKLHRYAPILSGD